MQASSTLMEEELRAADEIANEENKDIIKSIVDLTPGLNTTDNIYKLQPKVQKHLDEIVIDAV